VLSCLGFPISFFSAVTGYTQSMSAVVGAMRDAKVSRLVAMTSWYTERKSAGDGTLVYSLGSRQGGRLVLLWSATKHTNYATMQHNVNVNVEKKVIKIQSIQNIQKQKCVSKDK